MDSKSPEQRLADLEQRIVGLTGIVEDHQSTLVIMHRTLQRVIEAVTGKRVRKPSMTLN
jgi:hypothetical protein